MEENIYRAFLIKYGEIGIKGKNKSNFEESLRVQIENALKPMDEEFRVIRENGRVFVFCPKTYDFEETVERLKRVFGIIAICPMRVISDKRFETICEETARYVAEAYGDQEVTFKVFCKRADKGYPMTSPEICMQVGGYLLERFPNLSVDIKDPQEKITIEVRQSHAYVYSYEIPGLGGMPVGSNGKAMLLLSGGIDSPVAGYMVAKRGVTIEATYFHAPPYTSERAKQKVVDLAKLVARYAGPIRLHVVNFTDVQLKIYEVCPHDELTIIMRRYMMRIAEEIAKKNGCMALVTGESIGQVASQTIQSLACTNEVCDMPVFRPLIAFDKADIVAMSEQIGTFETSILPFEDCCTIFVAKHPVTKPIRGVIRASEAKLRGQIEDLVQTAIDTEEVILCEGE